MIKLICWLGVLVIASEQSCINTGGVAHTLLALGATLLVLLIWRLLSEQGVLAFNIYERLVEIRDLMARQTQAPAAIQPALRDGD
ncbi:MAG: hypothetical protein ABI171_13510 [Collimonas sp.]|uniref:hypothetical protein n=1 Tax=Collimonas sp. TaxID=1963772 RepID=UPI0032644A42